MDAKVAVGLEFNSSKADDIRIPQVEKARPGNHKIAHDMLQKVSLLQAQDVGCNKGGPFPNGSILASMKRYLGFRQPIKLNRLNSKPKLETQREAILAGVGAADQHAEFAVDGDGLAAAQRFRWRFHHMALCG